MTYTTIRAIATDSDEDRLAGLLAAAASTQIALTPMQCASDKRNLPLLRTIMATAERISFTIEPSEKINLAALNKALAEGVRDNRIKQSDRWNLKAQLAQLHLI
jgi:hypothetical protein